MSLLPKNWAEIAARNGQDPQLVQFQIYTYGWTVSNQTAPLPEIAREYKHATNLTPYLGAIWFAMFAVWLAYTLGKAPRRAD